MKKYISINSKISSFKKIISIPGDKSLSIRWVLFSSLASGVSTSKNLLLSEDVLAAIEVIKKFGIKVKKIKIFVKFTARDLMDINIKKILF